MVEAEIRAKTSACKADMRTLSTAIETYNIDNNRYPETYITTRWERFNCLTTPISYINDIPKDVFHPATDDQDDIDWGPRHGFFKLGATPIEHPTRYAMSSDGPDRDEDSVPIKLYPGGNWDLFLGKNPDYASYMVYDPTNGTVSSGDLWRASDFNFS